MSDDFTKDEAEAFVGKMFESLVDMPGVPKGTYGRAVQTDQVGDHWDVLIEWVFSQRPLGRPSRRSRDWITKGVMQKYLREVHQ